MKKKNNNDQSNASPAKTTGEKPRKNPTSASAETLKGEAKGERRNRSNGAFRKGARSGVISTDTLAGVLDNPKAQSRNSAGSDANARSNGIPRELISTFQAVDPSGTRGARLVTGHKKANGSKSKRGAGPTAASGGEVSDNAPKGTRRSHTAAQQSQATDPKEKPRNLSAKNTPVIDYLTYHAEHRTSRSKTDAKELKVIFLGGVGEIGKNMTAIEYDGDIIVIDAGMTFPSDDMPGVDYIIPDLTYLAENKSRVRALLLTHGHEDHIGAIRHFVKSFPYVPIYGSNLTLALVNHKLDEAQIPIPVTHVVENGSVVRIASFNVEFLNVSHSISGALALAIGTPKGLVFHTGDYKIDYTPIDNKFINLPRMAELGKKGVLLMLGESTNVEREGYTMSERTVGQSFDRLFAQNTDKRIIIATFASNVHRLQQIVDVAAKYGRQVALAGRSMENIYNIAVDIGELKEPEGIFVDLNFAMTLPDSKVVIVVTGSQGEPLSALSRMADGKFNKLTIGPNDTVIMSSTPIPGNERTVYNTINKLSKLGANVLYESLHDLHVSGHACREELKITLSLLRPRYFVPVHGEYRHLRKHAELAASLGIPRENIAIAEIGDCIAVKRNCMEFLPRVTAGDMFVDGLTIDNMSSVILKDRRRLSGEGVLIVIVGVKADTGKIDSRPDFILKGLSDFPPHVLSEAERIVEHLIQKTDLDHGTDSSAVEDSIVKAMRSYLSRTLMLNPMIIPIVLIH